MRLDLSAISASPTNRAGAQPAVACYIELVGLKRKRKSAVTATVVMASLVAALATLTTPAQAAGLTTVAQRTVTGPGVMSVTITAHGCKGARGEPVHALARLTVDRRTVKYRHLKGTEKLGTTITSGPHKVVLTLENPSPSKARCRRSLRLISLKVTKGPTPPTPAASAFAFAPYVDTSLYPQFKLAQTARDTGVRYYSLAFVVSGPKGCQASWGGVTTLAQETTIASEIKALRALGGDALVSFGGAAGTELAGSCTSATATAAQYQAVIDKYGLTRIDFDIEGGALADPTSTLRRAQAIALLQSNANAAGKRLDVTFTLPVFPSGLTADGIKVMRSSINAGVRVTAVNGMAMDYGSWAAPNPVGHMGDYAIDVANGLKRQLHSLYPSLTDRSLWKMVGVTPMIGVNDVASEIFLISDAHKLVSFAKIKHLNMLSMWSGGRDKQCSGGAKQWADATCSSIVQRPFEFTQAFIAYTG